MTNASTIPQDPPPAPYACRSCGNVINGTGCKNHKLLPHNDPWVKHPDATPSDPSGGGE